MTSEHPRFRRSGSGRALSRRACRNTALVLSWLVIVAIGSTASAAALGSTASTLGSSHTLHTTRAVARVGAIFQGPVSSNGDHHCTAGVVSSATRNLIVTAAHCLNGGGDDLYFVPGYHDGQTPYGVWKLEKATLDPRWNNDQDPDFDVAFVTVAPHGSRQIQDVLGGYTLGIDRPLPMTSTVRLTGYPADDDAPLTCVNHIARFNSSQLRIACAAYSGGTSGSPWVVDDSTVIGVIGGYEQGGDSDDVSYSPYFGDAIASLHQQAVASAENQ